MSLINKLVILSSLTEMEKNNLSFFCQEKILEKGETLFVEGEEASAMYILETGEIEIYKNFGDKDILLGKIKPEEVLGEMALFGKDGNRMATAIASENSLLLTILPFSIKELTRKHPELLKKIQNIIQKRIISNKEIERSIRGGN